MGRDLRVSEFVFGISHTYGLAIIISFVLLMSATACAAPAAPKGASLVQADLSGEVPVYPYTKPLPPAVSSAIDGVYAKIDPDESTPTPCRRCAEYRLEGGTWVLKLDKGTFRFKHTDVGWESNGSFTVSGDRITLFNDPSCTEDVGVYQWSLDQGNLTFKVIQDDCAIGLRAKNLMQMEWRACQPSNREAGISDHWKTPPGC